MRGAILSYSLTSLCYDAKNFTFALEFLVVIEGTLLQRNVRRN
jgi:hypothetical protein